MPRVQNFRNLARARSGPPALSAIGPSGPGPDRVGLGLTQAGRGGSPRLGGGTFSIDRQTLSLLAHEESAFPVRIIHRRSGDLRLANLTRLAGLVDDRSLAPSRRPS